MLNKNALCAKVVRLILSTKIIIQKVRLVLTTESVTQIVFLRMKKTKNDQYDRAQISNRH